MDDLECDHLNTTECILKYLQIISASQKSQSNEYNWDPVSVGVTAAIGVIALLIAILTIGQAILSAANGRHKASQYAIGRWSTL